MGAQVFLSYGHRDAGDIAADLRAEIEAAGHSVWQDVDGIRVSQGWSNEIADAIRGSAVMVALLTPHSVRRAGDPANPDGADSVCIDEIEYAVDGARIPVVPVILQTCEAPFRIFRLQYLDFRSSRESDSRYRELVEQLIDTLGTALETGTSPTRSWGFLPEPWDFSAFLAERRLRFTGRAWLFEELEEWRANPDSRSLLLTGGPGVGKSAIVAQLVHENPDGQVLAYHCCQADTPATLTAATFVRSIAGQLSSRLEGYANAIEMPDVRAVLDQAAIEADPASAFEAGVLAPLAALPEPEGGPRYLLVDALDEAASLAEGLTVLDVLVTRLSRFPSWLRVVATTRPRPEVIRRLRGLRAQTLDAEDERNRTDVREYARRRLTAPAISKFVEASGQSTGGLADTLLDVSGGNFLYVTQALDAVANGQLSLAKLGELPPGLGSLYERFFDRLFVLGDVPFERSRRLLAAIIASLEPASRRELSRVTGLDAESELPKLLGRLSAFVPHRGGRYALFHTSLTEWLTGWDEELDQPATAEYHVRAEAGHDLWASNLLASYDEGELTDPAVLQRLPTHLAGASRWADLTRVLRDWRFLESKVLDSASGVFDLAADFKTAVATASIEGPDLANLKLLGEIVRIDAQFIAQHPETLFQCCWNRGFWHDSPIADEYFSGEPSDTNLWKFVESWRQDRQHDQPRPWLRYLRPPAERLGSAQRAVLVGHTDALQHVAASPDGTRLVSADGEDDANVMLWEIDSASKLEARNLGDGQDLQGIAFTPDGERLVAAHWSGDVSILDADTLETTASLHVTDEPFSCMALSTDGSWLAVGDWAGVVHLVDVESWEVAAKADVLDGAIQGIALSPDGSRIVAGDQAFSGESSVVLCRRDPLEVEKRFASDAWITSVTFTPDGRGVVWGDYDGRAILHDLESGSDTVFRDAPAPDRFREPKVAPTGSVAFVGGYLLVGTSPVHANAEILVWDTQTQEIVHRLSGHQFGVDSLAPIGQSGRFASAGDSTVRVWDLRYAAAGMRQPLESRVRHLRFSESTNSVVTASDQSDRVWVRSIEDGSLLRTFDGHNQGVHSIELGDHVGILVCGTGDGSVQLWDLASGESLLERRAHGDLVGAVALSAPGDLAASGSNDGTVSVHSVGDSSPPLTLEIDDWPRHLAFSSHGDQLFIAGLSKVVMWGITDDVVLWEHDRGGTSYSSLHLGDCVVLEGVGEVLRVLDAATGEQRDVDADHRKEWQRRQGYAGRTWALRGTMPAGPELEEQNHQHMAELLRVDTGQAVGWLPVLLGGVTYHPSLPVWANRRGEAAWVFRLEGGEAGAR